MGIDFLAIADILSRVSVTAVFLALYVYERRAHDATKQAWLEFMQVELAKKAAAPSAPVTE